MTSPTDQAIQKAIEWAEATQDFVAREAPLLVNEIITFSIVLNAIGVVTAVVLIAILCWAVRWSWVQESIDDDGTFVVLVNLLGFMGVVGCCIWGTRAAYWLAMAIFAPRMYVIETLKGLL